jgi:hypothetical protein
MQRRLPVGRRQLLEHVFHKCGLEHRVGGAHPRAGTGESQMDLAPVSRIERPHHVPARDEPAHGDRHGPRRDAHVIGELSQHRGLGRVEMIQDAHLVGADDRSALGIPDVPAVATEIDARIVAKHRGDLRSEAHAENATSIILCCQYNIYRRPARWPHSGSPRDSCGDSLDLRPRDEPEVRPRRGEWMDSGPHDGTLEVRDVERGR